MSNYRRCLVKHMGKDSPIRAYRADMAEDVAELVDGGKDADAAWLEVIDAKTAELEAEQTRIQAETQAAYDKAVPVKAAKAKPKPVQAVDKQVAAVRAIVAAEGGAQDATHKDPSQPAEPVTQAVVTQAISKAAKNEERPRAEMRAELLAMIDAKMANAKPDDDADVRMYEATAPGMKMTDAQAAEYKRLGQGSARDKFMKRLEAERATTHEAAAQNIGYVTFDVPGDGKFKVLNTRSKLEDFRKRVEQSPGFKDQRYREPGMTDASSGGKLAAFSNMVDEGDMQAALDYAAATDLDPKTVKLSDMLRKRLDKWMRDQEMAAAVAEREGQTAATQDASAPDAAAKSAAPAAETAAPEPDAIDARIAAAEAAGVELSQEDKDDIRATLERADALRGKAGGISRANDPMRDSFPLGGGFGRGSARSRDRKIDASVKRATEASAVFQKADQAERFAQALLEGKGTRADIIRKAAKKAETQRLLIGKLLNWQKGDKIGPVTIARVNKDRDGYPATYTISGDGIIPGVMDKVDVVREFFGSSKDLFRKMVDEVRAEQPAAAAPAPAEAAPPAPPVAQSLMESFKATMNAVYDGTASVEDYKAAYKRVRDAAAVKAELGKMTKDDLIRTFGIMARPDEKKDSLVATAYKAMLRGFALGKEFGPRSYMMTRGGLENYEKQQAEALDAIVENHTAEDLAAYAAEVKASRDDRAAKRAAMVESVKDPKTLDDFRGHERLKMSEGMTSEQARMSLTPEQRALRDALIAESTRGKRTSAKDEQRTAVRVAGQMVDGDIIATKHTKKGHDLYVVKLAERVSREDYETLNEGAKRIGGYYSSFRGSGAIPGFQFTTREQAQAFVTLAGGDNTAAVEAAKERRDAYQDDRSQSAAERLTEMANKMEADADESLSLERKANTARRARFAASAEAGARNLKAMAKTMRNVAEALNTGKAKFLDRIRTRTQIELLQTYVANAQGDQLRAKYPTYAEQEKRKGQPPDQETADFATFPFYTAYRSDLASLGRQLQEVDGTKKIGDRLMKVADDVSDAFTAWAKEPGNLFKLSTFSVRAGDDVRTAIFKDRETAERAIKRSGLSGKAIVFPEKRGVNRIVMSPSEAIAKGIWQGDGDKRITLSDEFGAELVESIGRAARRGSKVSVPWQFERAYERRKQLARMGLETPAEFRSALREFISMREQAQEADRVKMLERAMVGKTKDGLDFFPTPESVADEMVAAADIRPDMAVLEPSAGMGHIADRIRAAGAEPDVVEMASDRRELLEEKGYSVSGRDFLDIKPREFYTYGDVFRAPDGVEGIMRGGNSLGRVRLVGPDGAMVGAGFYNRDEVTGIRHEGSDSGYDRIVMNPPFSDGRDIQHVMHAYNLLKPGGRVVAIMGESAFTNQNKRATAFREWLESVGGTEEKLPEGTFNDPSLPVNTGANARMVVIDRGETAANAPMFSRFDNARGISIQEAKTVAATVRAMFPSAPPIIVHSQVSEAPESALRFILASGAENDVEAMFHEGEIHVFANHLKDVERALFVVGRHEIRHAGFAAMFGGRSEKRQALLGIALKNRDLMDQAKQFQEDRRNPDGTLPDRITAIEEILADMPVERLLSLSGIDRLISKVRQWLRDAAATLRKKGYATLADAVDPKTWTDKDVAAFVLRAENVSRAGGGMQPAEGGTMFSQAPDAMPTEREFYRQYAQHIDIKGREAGSAEATRAAVLADGFKKGANVNALPPSRGGKPFNVMERDFAPMAGDVVYLAPRGAWASKTNGMEIQNGWKPEPWEVVTIAAADVGKPMYELFQREWKKYHDATMFSRTPRETQDRNAEKAAAAESPTPRDIAKSATQRIGELLNDPGTLTRWDKSLGTPYNLAQRFPAFKRVFEAMQDHAADISDFANSAADKAKTILPRLDRARDVFKGPLAAADAKAVQRPIFDGTLLWTRDAMNKPVLVADVEAEALDISVFDKSERLLRERHIDPRVLKMWQGMPLETFTQIIEGKYKAQYLRPGIVWEPSELKAMFGLNDKQVSIYREFRAATNASLDRLAITTMIRAAMDPSLRSQVEGMSPSEAAEVIRPLAEEAARRDALAAGKTEGAADKAAEAAGNKITEAADRVEQLQAEGYAPLMRFGTRYVDVIVDGQRAYFGMYEGAIERSRDVARLRAMFPGAELRLGTVSTEDYKLFEGVSPETLALFADVVGLTDKQDKNAMFQEYLRNAVNNRSAMKRLIQRKAIQGFTEDVPRVLAGFITSNARASANNLNTKGIVEAIDAIDPRDARTGQGELKDYAVQLREFMQQPGEQAAALRGMMFHWYLGGNISSALVNMTQAFQTTLPELSKLVGASKATKLVTQAMGTIWKKRDGALGEALKRAENEGHVSPQELYHLDAMARGAGHLRSGESTTDKAMAIGSNSITRLAFLWGRPFALAEQFNRRVTFIAAFQAAESKGLADPYAYAVDLIDASQFVYGMHNRPVWGRSFAGATLLTFKTFTISMLEAMYRNAKTPQGRKALVLMLLALFVLAGLEGLPFREDVEDVIDAIMQRLMDRNFHSREARDKAIKRLFNALMTDEYAEVASRFVQKGLSGLPGAPIDVAGRFSMANIIPGTGALTVKQDRFGDATELLGPVGGLVKQAGDAGGLLSEGRIVEGIKAALPTAGRNIAQGIQMATTGEYRDGRGNMVVKTDSVDAGFKAAGFQPNAVAAPRSAERLQQRRGDVARIKEAEMVNAFARAVRDDDSDAMTAAAAQYAAWNVNNPESRITITPAQVKARVKAMQSTSEERIIKRTPKEMRSSVVEGLAGAR